MEIKIGNLRVCLELRFYLGFRPRYYMACEWNCGEWRHFMTKKDAIKYAKLVAAENRAKGRDFIVYVCDTYTNKEVYGEHCINGEYRVKEAVCR